MTALPDFDAAQYAQTVAELTELLDGVDIATLPEDLFAGLIRLLNTAPEAPSLYAGGITFPPLDPRTLTLRTRWYTRNIAGLLDHFGRCVEDALADPWLRVGAAQFHRDGSNADLHAWRCHMDQVHTALVALDQLLDATPAPLHDTH
ncbi:Uncharacterised protein [Mycobacteroides abscessus subsp. abscessus]|uniref:hypothetical protein n=1 Tax=Mycobacteroides abscessus TaxID=36809 RepID=UPI0009A83AB8|nr:hypothetical protein [Mycobacteroides abscessus]SKV12415.1 Uncharacterised protein [Mycobacteroides abscessus subsp. abscessus]